MMTSQVSEALLLVDEPGSVGNPAQLACGSVAGCAIQGTASVEPYNGASGLPNIFRGSLLAANTLTFLGVCRRKVEMSYFGETVMLIGSSPFPSASIVQNGARCTGFASPRKNRAPLTAPRRSEDVLRRGKGGVCKSWPIRHFYFAGIGHFYFALTHIILKHT